MFCIRWFHISVLLQRKFLFVLNLCINSLLLFCTLLSVFILSMQNVQKVIFVSRLSLEVAV